MTTKVGAKKHIVSDQCITPNTHGNTITKLVKKTNSKEQIAL